MGLKKKILIGWLAWEAVALALALPAMAQMVDKINFSVPPRAAHVAVPQEPGKTKFIIASNAPFSIISQGAVGEMTVELTVQGLVNRKPFGKNAQNPGAARNCVFATSAAPSAIYKAVRKTAANRGAVIDQAVMIEISYDPMLKPTFLVKTFDKPEAKSAIPAAACNAISS